jgi:hypothetical protein
MHNMQVSTLSIAEAWPVRPQAPAVTLPSPPPPGRFFLGRFEAERQCVAHGEDGEGYCTQLSECDALLSACPVQQHLTAIGTLLQECLWQFVHSSPYFQPPFIDRNLEIKTTAIPGVMQQARPALICCCQAAAAQSEERRPEGKSQGRLLGQMPC